MLLAAGTTFAHGVGTSQLKLRVDGPRIEGSWDLDLRDARLALGLDLGIGGEAGWRDPLAREGALRAGPLGPAPDSL
jgi:hypothetical protein